ncbi:alpha/beta fold hydrolase [bacterium]|nr:alpha/beta fold hydrolase [bacterium]
MAPFFDAMPVTVWGDPTRAALGVIVLHGMTEHSVRYGKFGSWISSNGGVVVAIDHIGHGADAPVLGDLGSGGWGELVERAADLAARVSSQYPDVNWCLLGHSMGSFVVQDIVRRGAHQWAGIILTGASYHRPMVTFGGQVLAKMIGSMMGDQSPGRLLNWMLFGQFNRQFSPSRTPFDWLSRDNSVVDSYIDDPYCGFVPPNHFYYEMFKGIRNLYRSDVFKQFSHMPTLILSGADDPVTKNGHGSVQLARYFREFGNTSVNLQIFENLRHVILDECDNDIVFVSIWSWMGQLTTKEKPNHGKLA